MTGTDSKGLPSEIFEQRLGNDGIGGGCTTTWGCLRLSSATRRAESRPSRVGPISVGVKQMGARSGGKSACCCDVEGTWKRGTVERPAARHLDLTDERDVENGAMVELLRRRRRKGRQNRYVLPNATAPHLDSTKGRYRGPSRAHVSRGVMCSCSRQSMGDHDDEKLLLACPVSDLASRCVLWS